MWGFLNFLLWILNDVVDLACPATLICINFPYSFSVPTRYIYSWTWRKVFLHSVMLGSSFIFFSLNVRRHSFAFGKRLFKCKLWTELWNNRDTMQDFQGIFKIYTCCLCWWRSFMRITYLPEFLLQTFMMKYCWLYFSSHHKHNKRKKEYFKNS